MRHYQLAKSCQWRNPSLIISNWECLSECVDANIVRLYNFKSRQKERINTFFFWKINNFEFRKTFNHISLIWLRFIRMTMRLWILCVPTLAAFLNWIQTMCSRWTSRAILLLVIFVLAKQQYSPWRIHSFFDFTIWSPEIYKPLIHIGRMTNYFSRADELRLQFISI